jgi:hypothetical protein
MRGSKLLIYFKKGGEMSYSINESSSSDALFVFNFQVPTPATTGSLLVTDYSNDMEGVTVNRTGAGSYNCTFLTNKNIDISKLPEAFAGVILNSAGQPLVMGFNSFVTIYNANATNFPFTVTFNLSAYQGATPVDPAGTISIQLWWSLKTSG